MEVRLKKLFVLFLAFFAFSSVAFGQTRKSVSGAEVTGTFRSYFKGKFKGKLGMSPAANPITK